VIGKRRLQRLSVIIYSYFYNSRRFGEDWCGTSCEKLGTVKKRRNAWQSLACISLRSLLSRFSQYYLVALATSINKSENNVQIDHLHPKRLDMVKRLRKFVQYILKYSTEYASFLLCRTRSSQMSSAKSGVNTDQSSRIFTQYKGITYAVNAHIEVAISHSVSECQSDKWGEFAFFHKIGCHGNVPLDIRKRGPDRSSAPRMLLFCEKIATIDPADPEIIVLWAIIKKDKKKQVALLL